MKKAPVITKAKLLIPAEDNDLIDDVKMLASKGVYCFDITDYDNDDKFNCIALPEKAINISELPDDIQKLLSDHVYTGDVSEQRTITVTHAY